MPTLKVFCVLVSGSMREIVWSSALSAQTAPWPMASAVGLLPTATCATGLFASESIWTTAFGAGAAERGALVGGEQNDAGRDSRRHDERGSERNEAPAEPSPAAPDRGSLEPERGVRGGENSPHVA